MKQAKVINIPSSLMFAKGFSLLEVIVFITVIGVVIVGLMVPISTILRQVSNLDEATRAIEYAKGGVEMAMGEKRVNGFDNLVTGSTLCSPSCGLPGGYTLSVTVAGNWLGDTNFKVITSAVTGPGNATLTAVVARY